VLVINPNFDPMIGKYGSRPVKPDAHYLAYCNKKWGNYYPRLEESVSKEGFRNPIFCNAIAEGTFSKYGTSRLYIAKKLNVPVPTIIADYVGTWDHLEELKTKEDIIAKYIDPPSIIDLDEDEMTIMGCSQYHLKDTPYYEVYCDNKPIPTKITAIKG
tara:strand:+ start:63 stop:536 length:474 start_codon:yes stop_codon:yes gene_type:complete